jgi:hypothetical protein
MMKKDQDIKVKEELNQVKCLEGEFSLQQTTAAADTKTIDSIRSKILKDKAQIRSLNDSLLQIENEVTRIEKNRMASPMDNRQAFAVRIDQDLATINQYKVSLKNVYNDNHASTVLTVDNQNFNNVQTFFHHRKANVSDMQRFAQSLPLTPGEKMKHPDLRVFVRRTPLQISTPLRTPTRTAYNSYHSSLNNSFYSSRSNSRHSSRQNSHGTTTPVRSTAPVYPVAPIRPPTITVIPTGTSTSTSTSISNSPIMNL